VAPFAYLVAFGIVLMLGITLTQLAKHFPSAGGYYTYISRTVHPRAGFLTSWLYFLYDPTTSGYSLAFMGYILQEALREEYHVRVPWWLFFLISGSLVAFICYRGIELSKKVLVLLGSAEIAIVVALSLWGLVRPGGGGVNFTSFDPRNTPSWNGLALGVAFSLFALTGWEGVAPLAEESENPKRNLPRAILGSIIVMGIFLVVCSWGLLVGWGTKDVVSFAASKENPSFLLARRLWGNGWILVLLALLNSMLAVAIAANNAGTRVWYAMARSGSLPRWLARIHPRFQTPMNASLLQVLVMGVVGLGLGAWIGPEKEFDFMGLVVTFALIFVYSAGNLGVFLHYFRERRSEFRWVLHFLFPLLGTAALFGVGYASLVPWPDRPISYVPLVVGAWFVVGVVVLAIMKHRGDDDWMVRARHVIEERTETRDSP
jgi:amino acid transporter